MPAIPYDQMDIAELAKFVVYTDTEPHQRREALSALSRRDTIQRTSRLIMTMEYVLKNPDRYDQDMMMSIIDLFATDPEPNATVAMLDLLPLVASAILDNRQLKDEFREYFYTALMTRRRDEDLDVWAEMLPELDPKTLVGAASDPVAGVLVDIEPVTLLDRQPEPHRTRALFYAVSQMIQHQSNSDGLVQAVKLLTESNPDSTEYQRGIEALSRQLEKAQGNNDRTRTKVLMKVLGQVDRRSRSAGERLTGKRPWAP